jgi:DMSO/TMAO reductase YedYZ molybdopterin-dependent catalytic subunit
MAGLDGVSGLMTELDFITEQPPNASVPLRFLDGSPLGQDRIYMRNSFPAPEPGRVTGGIQLLLPGREPEILDPDLLAAMTQVTMDMVLECAGNGRSLMKPVPDGLPWHLGGVSPIRVTGVRLRDALGSIPREVVEIVFTGLDRGEVWPEGEINYQFSIDAKLARSETPVLVTSVGGELLGHEHGGPIRLIVPGHYAMKSVKWLTEIEGVTEPFGGHFVNRYRYLGDTELEDGTAVGSIKVRSVIARPEQDARLRAGPVTVEGSAWSGEGQVTLVEISVDGGRSWAASRLAPGAGEHAPAKWRHELVLGSGRHTIIARATDSTGSTQPLRSRWNRRGYGNNAVHRLEVEVG